jgi:excisionase family DNA binding protein
VTERLLTARELAELLGLSAGTVLDRFEHGDLPGFRLGGRTAETGLRTRLVFREIAERWIPEDVLVAAFGEVYPEDDNA